MEWIVNHLRNYFYGCWNVRYERLIIILQHHLYALSVVYGRFLGFKFLESIISAGPRRFFRIF